MPLPNTTILLIRHAEKLPWHSGLKPSSDIKAAYIDNHILSTKGYERAQALVPYFHRRSEITSLVAERPWGGIIAQAVDDIDGFGKSERPKETVLPFAESEGIKGVVPFVTYRKALVKEMVGKLLGGGGGEYEGRTVLVSWCHQMMSDIVKALGVKEELVPVWDKKRFDVTWVVKLNGDRGSVEFEQLPQRLLYGDGDSIIPLKKGD
ncbi:uncharacterized protein EV422DRAFT_512913 [Fimicolochytrium jonesii]|uniref:uncharacterized protein n=1 Tax=Fimicolochytrium jonesii TaxID=1396493 RepID=UPI0022FF3D57|nr:uncharacterized protein EV422DRAFT_512913 [Fimicolochytrium jonesii]KAI8827171.1 hypothetical protein EV422DRAFT_512913 [Fimicolochytrium jonesii]